eukprot:3841609-Amphidinium_carterae.1
MEPTKVLSPSHKTYKCLICTKPLRGNWPANLFPFISKYCINVIAVKPAPGTVPVIQLLLTVNCKTETKRTSPDS